MAFKMPAFSRYRLSVIKSVVNAMHEHLYNCILQFFVILKLCFNLKAIFEQLGTKIYC